MVLALALAAAFGWGASDFAAGRASRASSVVSVVIATHLTSLLAMGLVAIRWPQPMIVAGYRNEGHWLDLAIGLSAPSIIGRPGQADLWWGIAAGVSGGLGAALLFRGLSRGATALVAPITAVGGAALPLAWTFANGASLTITAGGGLAAGLIAILLISMTGGSLPPLLSSSPGEGSPDQASSSTSSVPDMLAAVPRLAAAPRRDFGAVRVEVPRYLEASAVAPAQGPWLRPDRWLRQPGLTDALLSGVGFGLFFVFVERTSSEAGLWPLLSARAASVLMFVVGARLTHIAIVPGRGSRRASILAGILDAAAAALFLLATRRGALPVVVVLVSLYPGVTVVLARAVAKERLQRRQLAGMAVAGVAVALLVLAR